ncbi:hypothetical protein TNCV_2798381 [Trichonephila clavipes]|nr:hypothetical protein TNCV_2798381 [Trichonephila clavipes]
MADRSKALRLDHIPLLYGRVSSNHASDNIILLSHFLISHNLNVRESLALAQSGWRRRSKRCLRVAVHFCGRGSHNLNVKETLSHMSGWPSGLEGAAFGSQSHLCGRGFAKLNVKENFSHVRMADRSIALRLDHIRLLWAWDSQRSKAFAFVSGGHWTRAYHLRKLFLHVDGRSSKALRLDHIPAMWRGFESPPLARQ